MSAFGNYPPGVTDADIDRYFGPDEEDLEKQERRLELWEAEMAREEERQREDRKRAVREHGSNGTDQPLAGHRIPTQKDTPMSTASQRRVSIQRLGEIYRALRGEALAHDRVVTIMDLDDIHFGNFGPPEMTFAEFMDIQTSVQLYDEEDGDA
jgi:hypothetical protein